MKTVASEKFKAWMRAHPMPEVVRALCVSAQTINNWRSGRQTPQYHHRLNIKTLTGNVEPAEWLSMAEATL
jgi:hypothetical protein